MREEDPSETSAREGGGGESLSGAGTTDRRADRPQEMQQAADASPDSKPSGRAEGGDAELAGREHEPSESGEGASQRAGGAGAKRSEELLLKNRKAQRRFRERQKSKITELEEKNAELTTELKRLQQENQNLDSKMTALVRVVHQKNAQLDQLRSSQAVGVLDEEASAAFTDDLVLSWSEGQTFALTPEQVRGLSREDLIKIWKEYVQQLASLLGEVDNGHPKAQQAAAENIQRLTHELTMILLRVSICNPLVAKNFAAYRLEEPNVPGDDPETTWRSIVSTLMLSGEQRSELVQLRQLFLGKVNAIWEQRGEILNALYETLAISPTAASERVSSLQFLKAHEAANLLRQSLREDHALKLDFLSTVMKHGFQFGHTRVQLTRQGSSRSEVPVQLISPIQLARCLVQSYPWFPDTLALTSYLAADAGDTQAMAFFGSGTLSAAATSFPISRLPLSLSTRTGGSGFSTPRNATPTTPQRSTAAPSPFQVGQPVSPGGASWAGMSSHQLLTQHSGHSGMQYGLSPGASPLYTPLSPSPAPSPPLSPSHAIMPGLPKPEQQQPPQPRNL